jgi:hypothetical protein
MYACASYPPLDTDREALDEVMKVIERDGIRSFLDSDSEAMP